MEMEGGGEVERLIVGTFTAPTGPRRDVSVVK